MSKWRRRNVSITCNIQFSTPQEIYLKCNILLCWYKLQKIKQRCWIQVITFYYCSYHSNSIHFKSFMEAISKNAINYWYSYVYVFIFPFSTLLELSNYLESFVYLFKESNIKLDTILRCSFSSISFYYYFYVLNEILETKMMNMINWYRPFINSI